MEKENARAFSVLLFSTATLLLCGGLSVELTLNLTNRNSIKRTHVYKIKESILPTLTTIYTIPVVASATAGCVRPCVRSPFVVSFSHW